MKRTDAIRVAVWNENTLRAGQRVASGLIDEESSDMTIYEESPEELEQLAAEMEQSRSHHEQMSARAIREALD